MRDALLTQGVIVHAITAEKGGDQEVKDRFVARGTPVQMPMHSDPEHRLLPTTPGSADVHSLFVKKEMHAKKYGGTYEDYTLVQPALVVANRHGAIIQLWSWKTKPLCEVKPMEEMTPVGWGKGALFSVRPLSKDLGPSIKEKRPVKLQGVGMMTITLEMFRGPRTWSELLG